MDAAWAEIFSLLKELFQDDRGEFDSFIFVSHNLNRLRSMFSNGDGAWFKCKPWWICFDDGCNGGIGFVEGKETRDAITESSNINVFCANSDFSWFDWDEFLKRGHDVFTLSIFTLSLLYLLSSYVQEVLLGGRILLRMVTDEYDGLFYQVVK